MKQPDPEPSDVEVALGKLVAYRNDPVLFVREVMKGEPDERQAEIMRAVAEPGSRVSVRSGHGVGKSTCLAWLILWFVSLMRDCKVPCTAPSSNQLFDNLWAEIALWRGRMDGVFASELRQLADRLEVIGSEKTRFAAARTASRDRPEALQGFHAKNLMFVVDEASGVLDEVFTGPVEGALSTEGARIVMMSNPTRSEGYFYDSHHKDRKNWKCFTLNAEECKRVSPEECRRKAEKYGRDSNYYRVRVLGEFPLASQDQLIPLEWVTSAVGRDIEKDTGQRRIAGLDVARFGDDSTAFVIRQGPVITYIEEWSGQDLMQTVGRIVRAYREKRMFDVVAVDVIGMGGGVVDRLREQGIPVYSVNVAEASSMRGGFHRLRDELWWSCREWFEGKGVRIEPGLELTDKLIGELTTVRYKVLSAGKILVESKDEMKKRKLASPNIADSVCLTFTVQGVKGAGWLGGGVVEGGGTAVEFADYYSV